MRCCWGCSTVGLPLFLCVGTAGLLFLRVGTVVCNEAVRVRRTDGLGEVLTAESVQRTLALEQTSRPRWLYAKCRGQGGGMQIGRY